VNKFPLHSLNRKVALGWDYFAPSGRKLVIGVVRVVGIVGIVRVVGVVGVVRVVGVVGGGGVFKGGILSHYKCLYSMERDCKSTLNEEECKWWRNKEIGRGRGNICCWKKK
jgi:hypothetical protein